MAVKIRLARRGNKKNPYYEIVVADARAPRDGKRIAKLGTYNPLLPGEHPDRIVVKNHDEVKNWISNGAQPTERVAKLLKHLNITA